MSLSKSSVHVNLDTEILIKFTKLSQKTSKSRTQIINELIVAWVEDYEDYLLAEYQMQEITTKKDNIISATEFKHQLAKLTSK